MAAVTLTELSHADLPSCLATGTSSRRTLVFARFTAAGTSDTLTLTTYVPEIKDIETIIGATLDGADVGPTDARIHTWSGAVLTTAGDSGSHVWELAIVCTIT